MCAIRLIAGAGEGAHGEHAVKGCKQWTVFIWFCEIAYGVLIMYGRPASGAVD